MRAQHCDRSGLEVVLQAAGGLSGDSPGLRLHCISPGVECVLYEPDQAGLHVGDNVFHHSQNLSH